MKYIKVYEEETGSEDLEGLLSDMGTLGIGGLVGFMWVGEKNIGGGINSGEEQMGFLVIGKNERDCVDLVLSSGIFGNHPLLPNWFKPNSDFKGTFVGMLERLFEKGVISDAGHYSDLKARGGRRLVKSWYDPYMMNPKYCYDQAKEYFINADEVFSKEEPEWEIWTP